MAAGAAHSLALCTNGAVYSFGRNACGQCGGGPDAQDVLLPCRVIALDKACEVLAHGDASAAAVMSASELTGAPEEEVYLWGGPVHGGTPARSTAEAVAKAMRLL